MADPQGPTETARMSVRPLWCPSMWLIDTQGREPFEQICGDCGIEPHHMLDSSQWVELEKAGAFLERVRSLADTEQAFHEVCAHRIREGYGPLLHVLPVATPRLLFRAVARTVSLFSNVSRGSVLHESRTHSVLRYHSSMPELETRELCLTRVAAMTDLPNLFGLPPALIKENACIARGDEYCEYECRFYTRNRWLPMVGGVVVGGAIAYGLDVAGIDPSLGWSSLPVVFGLLGAIWELRKTAAANVDHGQRIQAALEELAENEGDARREILAFHQRQKEWGKLMEEQVSDRTEQLRDLLDRLEAMGEARVSTVRGVSHDLRNPVTILGMHQALLRRMVPDRPDVASVLDDSDDALATMEKMLEELTEGARSDRGLVPFNPTEMEIGPWVEILRRRVKALAFGKDVGVSVFRRREAPERIETDRLIFERVADNLCSNAVKYTERGSIIVELDGKPGFLTLKVSDTGVGIEQDRIERIFEPNGKPDARVARSLGVGLSVVVQLMGQIGGRLEVMSKPGRGTTFWAHFPVTPPAREEPPVRSSRPIKLADVVTIRRAQSA